MTDFLRYLHEDNFILVSNREPYEHVRGVNGIEVRQPAGGLVSALDPTLRRIHGTWVAWGSGSADRETSDESGRLQVPPGEGSYTLRRVWLEDNEVEAYYQGFANRSLWPLCHMLIHHFEYRSEFWDQYRAVNLRFAHAVADEAERHSGRSMAWIQDYHFALVPEYLRAMRPHLFIHQFWHIPFPPPDILRLLPSGSHEMLLRGLLGNDLMEFQVERYALNFLDCVAKFIPGAKVDPGDQTIRWQGRVVQVGAFPISIDFERYRELAQSSASETLAGTLRARYAHGTRQLGVSVDRMDYTKGIPERLRALDQLWHDHPEMRFRFTFIFVCTPSRSNLPAYMNLEKEVGETVLAINARYGTPDWTPIVLINENIDSDLLAAVYRAADICMVSSLQDGMNLVAKEFVAAQVDERGVLLLSRFTGAAEEIDGAVLINPFNLDGFVSAIRAALEMPTSERRRRMRRMRRRLQNNTIFDWLDGILARSADIMDARPTDSEAASGLLPQAPAEAESFITAIEQRLDRSPLVVMLDIDGTIAPIAPTPDHVVVPSETRRVIQKLVSLPDVHVAFVSGRSVTDAARIMAVDGAWIIGNHGLEVRTPHGDLSAVSEAGAFEDAIARASKELTRVARATPGALLENKRWTLSLHYRLVDARHRPELIARAREVARDLSLRAAEGKKVVELFPPVDVNKGTAAITFAKRVGALDDGSILYAGDDRTDEDAFRALRSGTSRAVTIRIRADASDNHAAPPTQAEYTLASPEELRRVLDWLVARRSA